MKEFFIIEGQVSLFFNRISDIGSVSATLFHATHKFTLQSSSNYWDGIHYPDIITLSALFQLTLPPLQTIRLLLMVDPH